MLSAFVCIGALTSLAVLLLTSDRTVVERGSRASPGQFNASDASNSRSLDLATTQPIKGADQAVISTVHPQESPATEFQAPGDASPFESSVFDKIPDEKFDQLDPIQQTIFVHAEERFNEFYSQWSNMRKSDPEEWNQKVKEFQQEMLLDLGPEIMDKLLSPATPRDHSP